MSAGHEQEATQTWSEAHRPTGVGRSQTGKVITQEELRARAVRWCPAVGNALR